MFKQIWVGQVVSKTTNKKIKTVIKNDFYDSFKINKTLVNITETGDVCVDGYFEKTLYVEFTDFSLGELIHTVEYTLSLIKELSLQRDCKIIFKQNETTYE